MLVAEELVLVKKPRAKTLKKNNLTDEKFQTLELLVDDIR